MANVTALLEEHEEETILDLVYSSYDTEQLQGLSAKHLQSIYEDLRHTSLSIPQTEAAINYTCACPHLCDREEMLDCLKEMDRRCFLAKELQWEFAMLDRQRKGAISITDASFLFKMVFGEFFSKYKFEKMIKSRVVADSDVSFAEIEVQLCNIPTHDWIEELLAEEEREKEEKEFKRREEERIRKEKEEQQQIEEEMTRHLEEEDRIMREKLAKREQEEEENSRIVEAEKRKEIERNKEMEKAKKRKEAEEKARKANEAAAEAKRYETEQKKLDKERLAEKERIAVEQVEKERSTIKLAEQVEMDRLAAEQAENKRLELENKEKIQTELTEEVEAAKLKKKEARALDNWKKAKHVANQVLREKRMQAVRQAKSEIEAEMAEKESEDADAAQAAENSAENEALEAEKLLKNASTEEEKRNAEERKRKAEADALKNREKRLRLTLKAAVKIRHRPKIDAAVIEAKDSEIHALKPDIEVAEKASDSIKCGEDLEDAMIKRDLSDIEGAVDKIKTKGYEKDHVLPLIEADRLTEKLKRLEKLKKEILALDQRTISEIRSYKTPLPAIHDVMIATYIILGYKEKELKEWKFIQALLGRSGKEGLKRMVTQCEASKINMTAAGVAEKKYLSKHDLSTVTDVSAGAATFFVWSTAMVDEANSWHSDSDFRKKVEEKRKLEEEEAKNLQEAKRGSTKQATNTTAQQKKSNEEHKNLNTGKKTDSSSRSRSPKAAESTSRIKSVKSTVGGKSSSPLNSNTNLSTSNSKRRSESPAKRR